MGDHLSWTSRLIRAFYSEGVRHVYVSPGSRSTPLVYGVIAHPGFKKHVILDERSAAFQALGTGKSTGLPSLLICTSGTAAANYYPAVIESGHSGIPLIVLSADRPPHLRGTGSSQTIDQVKLFGSYPLFFHELGEPVHREEDYRRLDLLAQQAVTVSVDDGGPVHINAAFRKPLEPASDSLKLEEKRNRKQMEQLRIQTEKQRSASHRGESDNTPRPDVVPDRFTVPRGEIYRNNRHATPLPPDIRQLIGRSKRPLIVAGPEEPFRSFHHLLHSLSVKLNIPVIAEPGSHLQFQENVINRFDILLGSDQVRQKLKPDLLIRAGDTPISKTLIDYCAGLAAENVPVIQFLNRDTWQDSTASIGHRIVLRNNRIDPGDPEPKPTEWLHMWTHMNLQAESLLEQHLKKTRTITDGHVVRRFTELLQNGWNIMTSNSFTVRDLALFGSPLSTAAMAYTNRGAAGIDGILSTGIGISHGTAGRSHEPAYNSFSADRGLEPADKSSDAAGVNLEQEDKNPETAAFREKTAQKHHGGGNEAKTAVLIGDLAFFHDSNALTGLSKSEETLLIIVINNRGGNIFRMLPVYDRSSVYTDYFETPQNVDISCLARAHDIPYLVLSSLQDLASFGSEDLPSEGPLIIECQTDPDHSMELRHSLRLGGKELA